jgi:anti-sigma factor RsiW
VNQQANTYEEMSCQELVELVTDYLDGVMPAELTARFERHIDSCAGCRTHLEQIRATIRVTGGLSPESLSPDTERALLDAFRGWNPKSG